MKRFGLSALAAAALVSFGYAGGDIAPMEPEVVVEAPSSASGGLFSQWNVGLKGGTLGLGVDVSTPLSEKLGVRFNLNGLKYGMDEEIDDVDYDGDLELLTAGLLLDYYPFSSTFRISAGVYYNDNIFKGSARPTAGSTVDINDIPYDATEVGQLDAEITFNKFSPYVGIGWGNDTFAKGWSFSFDLGVMYHGTPEADLVATRGSAVDDATFAIIEANVAAEEESLQDEIDSYRFYPVVMVGVNYRF